MEPLTIRASEAAELSGISVGTIYAMCRAGEIPCKYVGNHHGKLIIPRRKFIEWLEAEGENNGSENDGSGSY